MEAHDVGGSDGSWLVQEWLVENVEKEAVLVPPSSICSVPAVFAIFPLAFAAFLGMQLPKRRRVSTLVLSHGVLFRLHVTAPPHWRPSWCVLGVKIVFGS